MLPADLVKVTVVQLEIMFSFNSGALRLWFNIGSGGGPPQQKQSVLGVFSHGGHRGLAVLATPCPSASSNGPAGETTALWDSLLFGVALGGFLNISPVSLELHLDAHSSTHNDVNS